MPVLSITRFKLPLLFFGSFTFKVLLRFDKVEWSGTGKSTFIIRNNERTKPSTLRFVK